MKKVQIVHTKNKAKADWSYFALGMMLVPAITLAGANQANAQNISKEVASVNTSVDDFESCAEATGIVALSVPAQCYYNDQVFIEELDDEDFDFEDEDFDFEDEDFRGGLMMILILELLLDAMGIELLMENLP